MKIYRTHYLYWQKIYGIYYIINIIKRSITERITHNTLRNAPPIIYYRLARLLIRQSMNSKSLLSRSLFGILPLGIHKFGNSGTDKEVIPVEHLADIVGVHSFIIEVGKNLLEVCAQ